MKRHIQEPGIRKWSGNDLLDLQGEPLKILDGFFSQWGDCVICGCKAEGMTIGSGLASIGGYVLPVSASEVRVWPVYLVAAEEHIQREYADDVVRDVVVRRYAEMVYTRPADDTPYIIIEEDGGTGFFEGLQAAWLTAMRNTLSSYGSRIRELQETDAVIADAIDTLIAANLEEDARLSVLEAWIPTELDHVPGAEDDGYGVGMEVWVAGEDGERTFYKCHDNTEGAAVWKIVGVGAGSCKCQPLTADDILAVIEGRPIDDDDEDDGGSYGSCDCGPLTIEDILAVIGGLSVRELADSSGAQLLTSDGMILKTKNQ